MNSKLDDLSCFLAVALVSLLTLKYQDFQHISRVIRDDLIFPE